MIKLNLGLWLNSQSKTFAPFHILHLFFIKPEEYQRKGETNRVQAPVSWSKMLAQELMLDSLFAIFPCRQSGAHECPADALECPQRRKERQTPGP